MDHIIILQVQQTEHKSSYKASEEDVILELYLQVKALPVKVIEITQGC